jgi:hypothetical protein
MTAHLVDRSQALAGILAEIRRAEAIARLHDQSRANRDHHAEAAQQADELAEAGRRVARSLIEQAFPGVSWSMIEDAGL